MPPSAASSAAVPVKAATAAAGEAPEVSTENRAAPRPVADRPAEIGERRAEVRVGQLAAGAELEVLLRRR